MRKSSKHNKRSRRVPADRSVTVDVVTQLETAIRNPHAALIGAVLGGLVPWFGRTLAHGEIQLAWGTGNRALAIAMIAVVIGCGAFSGLSVFKFGKTAFGDPLKALGFVLALEGVMLVSHGATSAVALMALILINAVANGSVIALARDATRRKREADARGAVTRARNRASGKSSAKDAPAPAMETPLAASSAVPGTPAGPCAPGTFMIPVRWRRASLEDVADAEIVGEKLLA